MEFAQLGAVVPHSSDIREKLWHVVEKEFNACLQQRELSCDPSGSVYDKPLIARLKQVLTLRDAVGLLEQFLDENASPEEAFEQYLTSKQDERLTNLWQRYAESNKGAAYLYTRILKYALKLVSRAGIGIYYRAVFSEILDNKFVRCRYKRGKCGNFPRFPPFYEDESRTNFGPYPS